MKMKWHAILIAGGVFAMAVDMLADPAVPAPSQAPVANPPLEITTDKTGDFTIEGVEFAVMHKSDSWVPSYQQRSLTPDTGYPKDSADSHEIKGTFKTDSGAYEFSEEIKSIDPDSASYKVFLKGTPTKESRQLYVSATIPVDIYKGQNLLLDDKPVELPWWFKSLGLLKNIGKVSSVRLPLRDGGTLVIEGNFEAYLQDNRTYGPENYDLQLMFSPHTGSIQDASLNFTIRRVPASDPLAVAFDPNVKRPERVKKIPTPQQFQPDAALIAATLAGVRPMSALRPKGENFVDDSGHPVNLWGMNVVAFYPEHGLADKTAENLVSVGINFVRLHHNLRNSLDWDRPDAAALLTYEADSRTPNLKAWDRFDYFNAKLREKGIYLSLSVHGTRSYMPDDVTILKVSPGDDEAWADAMDELDHWPWKKGFDPRKMLPVFDERCFLLNAEYARTLLTHVNPYTGMAYGKDPQVATLEFINEFSSEYTLVNRNPFPDYWTRKLNAMLGEYAKSHGIEPFDICKAQTPEQRKCLSDFCNSMDEAYAERMKKVVRDAGCDKPVEFSNLWRGDANLRVRAKTDDFIEDHSYDEPLVVKDPDKFIYNCAKSALADKPFIIGEFSMSENQKTIMDERAALPMLPLAIAAYSGLQNYSGIVWFAWCHGAGQLGPDGWGQGDPRNPKFPDVLGCLAGNGPVLDHIRSAGLVFKNRYLKSSVKPQTVFVDDAYFPAGYTAIMNGEFPYKPGWQAVHGFRTAFGPVPPEQAHAEWTGNSPANRTVSDTNEIVRDSARRQLSFAAPKAEGLSGYLDGKPIGNLSVLDVAGNSGFATVIAVTLDDTPLVKSRAILVSRTFSDASGKESSGLPVTLAGLEKGIWIIKVTRPLAEASAQDQSIEVDADGKLKLPATIWNECELRLK